MKGFMKFLAALTVIGGIVFVVIKYLDQITAFLKKYLKFDWLLEKIGHKEEDCFEDEFCDETFTEEVGVDADDKDFEG